MHPRRPPAQILNKIASTAPPGSYPKRQTTRHAEPRPLFSRTHSNYRADDPSIPTPKSSYNPTIYTLKIPVLR
ncbi:hypothetical protein L209DRAFT_757107 [Thermothelomyces heterothallicus CBS 203.75]